MAIDWDDVDDGSETAAQEMAEDRKLYGDDLGPGTVDLLSSVGDPAFHMDGQVNDEHFIYPTDQPDELRPGMGFSA